MTQQNAALGWQAWVGLVAVVGIVGSIGVAAWSTSKGPVQLTTTSRSYDELRKRGFSDAAARNAAGAVEKFCTTAGGADC